RFCSSCKYLRRKFLRLKSLILLDTESNKTAFPSKSIATRKFGYSGIGIALNTLLSFSGRLRESYRSIKFILALLNQLPYVQESKLLELARFENRYLSNSKGEFELSKDFHP